MYASPVRPKLLGQITPFQDCMEVYSFADSAAQSFQIPESFCEIKVLNR